MPDRKPLMSGNWKMHHNHFEAIAAVQKLSYNLTAADYGEVDVSIHAPFTGLPLGRQRRLHRRDRPAHAGQAPGGPGDRRALRTP